MANDVPLPTNKSSLVISKHRIAMGIDYLDKQEKLNYSLLIKASKTYSTGYNDLSFKKSQDLELDVEDFSSLFISESLLSKVKMQLHSKEIKISVFLFDKSTLFRIKQGSKLNMKEIINSKIISVAINGTELNGLTDEEELQSAFRPQISVQKRQMTCVFWNFTASGKSNFVTLITRIFGLLSMMDVSLDSSLIF